MKPQATVDSTPGQLARMELAKRQGEATKLKADRQKLRNFLTKCPITSVALLEARRLGYGPDSAAMLVEQAEQELQQERDK